LKGLVLLENADRVLHYFEEISRIPRSSGDERAISEYLAVFAKEHGFEYVQDDRDNVIIKKPASVRNCRCEPVIIQGHTDMVYVRGEGCKRAYEDGIGLIYRDGWLSADGTTLGADNGIAVAFALALLDSEDIPHPDIEAVFTASEEIGMLGAENLDCSNLRGKYLINLDTEIEGVFFTSCAGAFRNELRLPAERETLNGLNSLKIRISGLRGGHSGMEIHEGRANAIQLMARILDKLEGKVHLSSLEAEGKTNAISNNAAAEIFADEKALDAAIKTIKEMERKFQTEYCGRDDVAIALIRGEKKSASCYTESSQRKIVAALLLIPCGVLGMSFNMPGLVESSSNPGYIEEKEDGISVFSLSRSAIGSRKAEIRARLCAIAELCGGESICTSDYPQWEFRQDSPLRALAMRTYEEMFGTEARTCAIHAGLECGYFNEYLNGVDIISYGPDLEGVHTPKERANLDSIERVWQLTQAILEKLAR